MVNDRTSINDLGDEDSLDDEISDVSKDQINLSKNIKRNSNVEETY